MNSRGCVFCISFASAWAVATGNALREFSCSQTPVALCLHSVSGATRSAKHGGRPVACGGGNCQGKYTGQHEVTASLCARHLAAQAKLRPLSALESSNLASKPLNPIQRIRGWIKDPDKRKRLKSVGAAG